MPTVERLGKGTSERGAKDLRNRYEFYIKNEDRVGRNNNVAGLTVLYVLIAVAKRRRYVEAYFTALFDLHQTAFPSRNETAQLKGEGVGLFVKRVAVGKHAFVANADIVAHARRGTGTGRVNGVEQTAAMPCGRKAVIGKVFLYGGYFLRRRFDHTSVVIAQAVVLHTAR